MTDFLRWYYATIIPAAAVLDCFLYAGCVVFVARKLWRRFRQNVEGVAAVEFAIIAPVFIALIAGATVIFQAEQQKSTATFVAQASAAAGARALAQGGALAQVQNAAQQVFTSNSQLWIFGATPSLQSVTLDVNNNVAVTVTATSSPVIPLPGFMTLSATSTATD